MHNFAGAVEEENAVNAAENIEPTNQASPDSTIVEAVGDFEDNLTGFGDGRDQSVRDDSHSSTNTSNLIVGTKKLALFRVINKQGDDNILDQSELEDALGNQEFLAFVGKLGIDLKQTADTADSARRVFECLDTNDSGDVTMNEFLQGLENLARGKIVIKPAEGEDGEVDLDEAVLVNEFDAMLLTGFDSDDSETLATKPLTTLNSTLTLDDDTDSDAEMDC